MGFWVEVLWDYDPKNYSDNAFKLTRGERLYVLNQAESGWWTGVRPTEGKMATPKVFPGNYVRRDPEMVDTPAPPYSGDSKSGNRDDAESEDWQNSEYFDQYGANMFIHLEMLQDRNRTETYRRAVQANAHFLKGATVLDIGCGTGILSIFCAQAGAAHVIAIEASNLATDVSKIISHLGLDKQITVVNKVCFSICLHQVLIG